MSLHSKGKVSPKYGRIRHKRFEQPERITSEGVDIFFTKIIVVRSWILV